MKMMDDLGIVDDGMEILPNENVLDIKIESAEFDKKIIANFLDSYMKGTKPDDILTVVTIAFHRHNLWPSAMVPGVKPQYMTNASFRNVMDGPYFDYLINNVVKFQVYLAGKDKENILLGTCEVPL